MPLPLDTGSSDLPYPEKHWPLVLPEQISAYLVQAPAGLVTGPTVSCWARALWTAPCPVLFVPVAGELLLRPRTVWLLADGAPWYAGWTAAAARALVQSWQPLISGYVVAATTRQGVCSRVATNTRVATPALRSWADHIAGAAECTWHRLSPPPNDVMATVKASLETNPTDLIVVVARRHNLRDSNWTRRHLLELLLGTTVPVLVVPE